ncbi:hypothetical protein FRACYDRAFT_249393 [Fragilariopsis cylindrus CCMP1102]|uniref:Uncharacterized protein n=1 Tax=Fragilariopsis cylindrus CCMP1102 TaxID=635003 RepID=A0A1E7ET83_9STRA|nr:hypothetical protein FRACYDRAFT_249393 [Fragilariopsis cylindrus CCMP1102]|eukprot:OEU09047.1 hypothetical protein FRACYDRAFT_249393 [Fragilariopsis cylindrus CCMP1102]
MVALMDMELQSHRSQKHNRVLQIAAADLVDLIDDSDTANNSTPPAIIPANDRTMPAVQPPWNTTTKVTVTPIKAAVESATTKKQTPVKRAIDFGSGACAYNWNSRPLGSKNYHYSIGQTVTTLRTKYSGTMVSDSYNWNSRPLGSKTYHHSICQTVTTLRTKYSGTMVSDSAQPHEHNAEANFKYKDYYTAVSRHNLKGGVPGCFRGRNGVRQEWFHHHHPTFMPNGNRQKSSPDQPQETLLMGTLFSAYEHINCIDPEKRVQQNRDDHAFGTTIANGVLNCLHPDFNPAHPETREVLDINNATTYNYTASSKYEQRCSTPTTSSIEETLPLQQHLVDRATSCQQALDRQQSTATTPPVSVNPFGENGFSTGSTFAIQQTFGTSGTTSPFGDTSFKPLGLPGRFVAPAGIETNGFSF